jgi:hypothetical protein
MGDLHPSDELWRKTGKGQLIQDPPSAKRRVSRRRFRTRRRTISLHSDWQDVCHMRMESKKQRLHGVKRLAR